MESKRIEVMKRVPASAHSHPITQRIRIWCTNLGFCIRLDYWFCFFRYPLSVVNGKFSPLSLLLCFFSLYLSLPSLSLSSSSTL